MRRIASEARFGGAAARPRLRAVGLVPAPVPVPVAARAGPACWGESRVVARFVVLVGWRVLRLWRGLSRSQRPGAAKKIFYILRASCSACTSNWDICPYKELKALRRGRPRALPRGLGPAWPRTDTGQVLGARTGVRSVRLAREPVVLVAKRCRVPAALTRSSAKKPEIRRRHAGG